MYEIKCPRCQGINVTWQQQLIGAKYTCPHCKKWFKIVGVNGEDEFKLFYLETPKSKLPGKRKK